MCTCPPLTKKIEKVNKYLFAPTIENPHSLSWEYFFGKIGYYDKMQASYILVICLIGEIMATTTVTRRESSESWKTACDNPEIDWIRSWIDKQYAKEHEDQCSFRSCCSCRAVIVVKGLTSPRVNCRICAEKRDTGKLPSVNLDPNRGLAMPYDFPAPDGSSK